MRLMLGTAVAITHRHHSGQVNAHQRCRQSRRNVQRCDAREVVLAPQDRTAYACTTSIGVIGPVRSVASIARIAWMRLASWPSRATTWIPTGRLSGVSPHGIDAAGTCVATSSL